MRGGRLIVWGLVVVATLGLAHLAWKWEIERIEVPTGKFLVVIHRWGRNLPPDTIVAPDDSYKGVLEQVRGPGRHFLNPFFYGHEIRPMVNVPAGRCGILTRKFGTPIPADRIAAGELLARDGERGVVGEPLTPGTALRVLELLVGTPALVPDWPPQPWLPDPEAGLRRLP